MKAPLFAHAQVTADGPLLPGRDLSAFVLYIIRILAITRIPIGKGAVFQIRLKQATGETHQHAVISMLVKQHHSSFRCHGDFLFGNLSVIREENGLTALASIACRR